MRKWRASREMIQHTYTISMHHVSVEYVLFFILVHGFGSIGLVIIHQFYVLCVKPLNVCSFC